MNEPTTSTGNQIDNESSFFAVDDTPSPRREASVIAPFRGSLSANRSREDENFSNDFEHSKSRSTLTETPSGAVRPTSGRSASAAPLSTPTASLSSSAQLPVEHVELLHRAQLAQLAVDVAPYVAPSTAPSQILYTPDAALNENATNGTVVGTFVGIDTDPGATLSYSLTDNAGGRFVINATTGVLTVADGSLLDFESATTHTLSVRVTDNNGLTRDETFTLTLADLNEAPTTLSCSVGALLLKVQPTAPLSPPSPAATRMPVTRLPTPLPTTPGGASPSTPPPGSSASPTPA